MEGGEWWLWNTLYISVLRLEHHEKQNFLHQEFEEYSKTICFTVKLKNRKYSTYKETHIVSHT